MQLHELKSKSKNQKSKRVGRGGKRGTYSGHGSKGQKSRAGARIRPGFRGGNEPIWKILPKQRGASKKVDIKHAKFMLRRPKPSILDLGSIGAAFRDGDLVSPKELFKRGLVGSKSKAVKILSEGDFKKKINFVGLKLSKAAKEKVEKAGGSIK
ncbi:MAG TPA: 50S ribosomal protein L15 [Candidatus Paceibacterota bacterium]